MGETLCRNILVKCGVNGVLFVPRTFHYIGKNQIKHGDAIYSISRNFTQLQNACQGNECTQEWMEHGLHYVLFEYYSRKVVHFFMILDGDVIMPDVTHFGDDWISLPLEIQLSPFIEDWQKTQLTKVQTNQLVLMEWMAEHDDQLPYVLHNIIVNYIYGVTLLREDYI